MDENASAPKTSKPVGIVVLAIYTGVCAVLYVLIGAAVMLGGAVNEWAPILGFALLIVGVVAATATYGLWVLVSWGYSLARIIYIVSIPLGLLALLAGRTAGNIVLQLVGIGLAIWILMYLAKPEIRGLFRAT